LPQPIQTTHSSLPIENPPPVPLDLQQLRQDYRRDLFDDFLPFFDRFVIDREYGGFLCSVRPNGELVSSEKRIWYEGRGTWAYSYLFNNFAPEQRYLDIAAASVALIQRSRPGKGDEFWPKVLNRDGSPASPPDTEMYGDMFVAEGFAEFSRATGNRSYWDQAREIVFKCVRRFDRIDYHPAIGETYLGPGARPFPGARIGGVWMVLIRTISQMLEAGEDTELRQILDRSIDTYLQHHFNPRFQLFNELINHDLTRPANEYEQLVYAGHAIEILWMMMYEARRRNDNSLFDRSAASFRRHCEIAQDRIFGGLFRNLRNVDENNWTLDKTLFVHQEALIGSMLLVEETGDPWASAFFSELNGYARAMFPMRTLNSPLWQLISDRQVRPTPEMTRAENYHHPRFLMLNLQAVKRLLQRQGTPRRAA
jgi:mannose/cellobiose epimerase-like protein (N-acyl-D-glucosamine 2-epimerase family)